MEQNPYEPPKVDIGTESSSSSGSGLAAAQPLPADVEAKAMELLGPRLGAAASQRLVGRIWALETVTEIGELVTAIAT